MPVLSEDAVPDFDAIDALARLLVGGTAELSDILLQQLEQWESDVASRHGATLIEDEEDAGDIVRYLLVGLFFDSQHRVRKSMGRAGSWLLGAMGTASTVTGPITRSRLFSPARRSVSVASGRLESEFARLVRIGRTEEFVGRLVAEEALQETVDWVMDYVAQNPQIRDLVEQQAVGFADEVTVGARERMITGDSILEGVFRRLFGRTSRDELPGPPAVVQQVSESMSKDGKDTAP